MKPTIYKAWGIWATACLLLASCSKEPAADSAGRQSVTIAVQMPALQSRAALHETQEEFLHTIDLLLFEESGTDELLYERIQIDQTEINNGAHIKSFSAELPVDGRQYRIVLLANTRPEVEAAFTGNAIPKGTPKQEVMNKLTFQINQTIYSSTPRIPMWGEAEKLQSFHNGDRLTAVQMIRAVARLDVTLSDQVQTHFELKELWLSSWYTKGRIAPEKEAFSPTLYEVTSPSVTSPGDLGSWFRTTTESVTGSERELYLCEYDNTNYLPEERTVLIVGGYVKGDLLARFYAIELQNPDGSAVDILRNHLYRIRIENIIATGFPTAAEAFEYLFPPGTRTPGHPAEPLVEYTIDTE